MSGMHACLLLVSCIASLCGHCLCTRLMLDALLAQFTQGGANAYLH